MNSVLENRKILSSTPVARLIRKYSRASHSRAVVRLAYGHGVNLSQSEQRAAKKLNSVYESVVWGYSDDADNSRVMGDEKKIIREFLFRQAWGIDVLEVGSGSGRVTAELLKKCERVTALDREAKPISRLRNKLRGNLKTVVADFASPRLRLPQKYSAICLFENLLGMNPCAADRARIVRNVERALRPGGLAIFAFRVVPQVKRSQILYQIMPYDESLFGVAINWSKEYFTSEIAGFAKSLRLVRIVVGDPRPAGGRMAFAVFERGDRPQSIRPAKTNFT